MPAKIQIPHIPEHEITPAVTLMLAFATQLQEQNSLLQDANQTLRDALAVAKGEKPKPKFSPSKMDAEAGKTPDEEDANEDETEPKPKKKRAGSAKRSKTASLFIHHEEILPPLLPLPAGAVFKSYRDFVVQELRIAAHNTRYRREVWQTADGQTIVAPLPAALNGQHFGVQLRAFILYQHHQCHVTQPLLREQLLEWGVDISVGQIDALLTHGMTEFINEKDAILVAGLAASSVLTVDDSGARHQGRNGYVTHIGNEFFAWFGSSFSKSRINFLELLHAGRICYQITDAALDYLRWHGLPLAERAALQTHATEVITDFAVWQQLLLELGITSERHRRIATEGGLLGSLLAQGFNPELAIISDGAGQFAILEHGLCWVHAERLVHKLIPSNQLQRAAVAQVRDEIWTLYAELKVYREQPDPDNALRHAAQFDAIFTQRTGYATLDALLKRLRQKKEKLLLVLRRPEVPLHTNGSETDIRDFVKKRKVSGGTRSDLGRQCRDTFASLKKTARKLGISFWAYLLDRISGSNTIEQLSKIVRQRAQAASTATGY